ncbi:MAG: beta-glucosidase [Bacteroidales bacterium]|nr:beta-glucosidase [Bacteroidales bacterium]
MKMENLVKFSGVVLLALLISCGSNVNSINPPVQISDDSLLTLIQAATFQYFWEGAEPNSGMARERYHMNGIYPENDKHIVAVGGSGFGMMGIITGIERGFISRDEGVERLEQIIAFLEKADRFHGAWPHWLNGETGKVKPFSRKDDGGDIVETAYLAQGLIACMEYFRNGNEREVNLAGRMEELWKGIEWDWYRNGDNMLYWHWSPNFDWEMNHPVKGYNECLIAYVLAASSPTYPIPHVAYHEGWAGKGKISGTGQPFGIPLEMDHHGLEYGGPLFWAHYSFLGLNPRNLKDRYADYWRHNQNHVMINRQYCIENPNNFKGYGENCWGLTSSYSIKNYSTLLKEGKKISDFTGLDPDVGYAGHSPAEDLSVISPTAALASFPYAPEECMKVARYFYEELGDRLFGPYGFYDAFSLEHNWFPEKYLAIDQGPILIMIENYRTGLLWDLFMKNKDVQNGLKTLGFSYD